MGCGDDCSSMYFFFFFFLFRLDLLWPIKSLAWLMMSFLSFKFKAFPLRTFL